MANIIKPTKTKVFDAAEYLESEADIQEFLKNATEEGDTKHLIHCLGVAARAKGMTEVAQKAGVTRASLYKSLEDGANPKIDTIVKVLGVFGCKLSVIARSEEHTSELQSRPHLVCRLLLEKKNKKKK